MTALSAVVEDAVAKNEIDIVFYDVGPNIGPLNRVILLDCDCFIVPAACDLFSLRALKTLGYVLTNWIEQWDTISSLAPDGVDLLRGSPVFLGYVPQRFRTYGGVPSATFASWMVKLEKQIGVDIVTVLRRSNAELAPWNASQSRIGQIKDFSGLVANAQNRGEALWDVAGPQTQLLEAHQAFQSLADQVLKRLVEIGVAQ